MTPLRADGRAGEDLLFELAIARRAFDAWHALPERIASKSAALGPPG